MENICTKDRLQLWNRSDRKDRQTDTNTRISDVFKIYDVRRETDLHTDRSVMETKDK